MSRRIRDRLIQGPSASQPIAGGLFFCRRLLVAGDPYHVAVCGVTSIAMPWALDECRRILPGSRRLARHNASPGRLCTAVKAPSLDVLERLAKAVKVKVGELVA
jgi:hypothetical protein